jgi:hypothetical protein
MRLRSLIAVSLAVVLYAAPLELMPESEMSVETRENSESEESVETLEEVEDVQLDDLLLSYFFDEETPETDQNMETTGPSPSPGPMPTELVTSGLEIPDQTPPSRMEALDQTPRPVMPLDMPPSRMETLPPPVMPPDGLISRTEILDQTPPPYSQPPAPRPNTKQQQESPPPPVLPPPQRERRAPSAPHPTATSATSATTHTTPQISPTTTVSIGNNETIQENTSESVSTTSSTGEASITGTANVRTGNGDPMGASDPSDGNGDGSKGSLYLSLGLFAGLLVVFIGLMMGLWVMLARHRRRRDADLEDGPTPPTAQEKTSSKNLQPSMFPLHRPVSETLSELSLPGANRDPVTETMVRVNPTAHTWLNASKMEILRELIVNEPSSTQSCINQKTDKVERPVHRLGLLSIDPYPRQESELAEGGSVVELAARKLSLQLSKEESILSDVLKVRFES